MGALDDHIQALTRLPKAKREDMVDTGKRVTKRFKWVPNPGPQTDAYFSKADCLLYGGEPGGGKSQLIAGLAYNEHQRSLILRRKYSDLGRIIEDVLKIHGNRDGYNGSPPPKLRLGPARLIEFGAAHRIGDEQDWMGKGRDLLGVDEATHFAESQIRFLMGWNRTEVVGQRVRTVLATNPPLTAEGLWVITMFAPWLDPTFPDPAKPGELRWVITNADGNDEWVSGPRDSREIAGRTVFPTSRTYIPASVSDNPEYAASDYQRQLDAMPEPYRSLLLGGFRTAFQDAPNQAIPTNWILEAQGRWEDRIPEGIPQCAIGVDATGGAVDPMVLAPRHDGYFPHLVEVPAKDIPSDRAGRMGAGIVIAHRRDRSIVVVDMGGGYGGPMYEQLKANDIEVVGYKGSETSVRRTEDGSLGFFNKRAEAVWKFREALNPDQPGGSNIALPPDPEMVADLASYTLDLEFNGIKLVSKVKTTASLGRSTNKGDAIIMSWSAGPTHITDGDAWAKMNSQRKGLRGRQPQVVMGRANRRSQ
ncbi:hypothetical protein UFOVP1670_13 [uncultured Caudovirales phage]|uniref:Terminase-like family n=1 Tax=uncultured Caudovirales phage TaxID=2100421 RepID=A0A6J5T816_9CAUD|nr:hypothetical protein UFOVP1670_13 [uncultured Caudovirales phage]